MSYNMGNEITIRDFKRIETPVVFTATFHANTRIAFTTALNAAPSTPANTWL